ncbi:MAG TPA: phosphoribosylformylglycinamidine cyclo-ligase [Herpetosiphonaceae bacterium]|nr:phosphoribosylformylglycinamidine cyclo-ligase [Herpetosiphonaceae bacterium]
MTSYAQAGVDIDAANHAKALMRAAVESTHGAAVLAGMGAFGGAFDLQETLARERDPVLVASTDSVGTKVLIARATGRYGTIGADLVNHCVNDILVQGARPLFFLDYIAAARLDPRQVVEIVGGVASACRDAGCALLGGETAELPGVYVEGAFDVAGTVVGVVDRVQLVRGGTLAAGDVVLGLPSTGLHTNGYSLARRICDPLGYDARPEELSGITLGDALMATHRSYLPELRRVWDAGVPIKAMAHITGGGLLENIPRVLPAGTGVVLRQASWRVPPIFEFLRRSGGFTDGEAYRVFNMGVGMVLMVAQAEVDAARALLPEAEMIGEVVEGVGVSFG